MTLPVDGTIEPQEETQEGAGGKERKLWRRVIFRCRCILESPVSIRHSSKLRMVKGKVDIGSKVNGGGSGKTNAMLLAARKVAKDIASSIDMVEVSMFDVNGEDICNCGKI
mmetsp:Transcript_32192/g.47184  ORF Transcript_32192/g.47184 Transcript_32192/m.47184 type:complete len:111 (+) Transcript_32192:256-588(+)